jgi:hypothetical protein
MMKLRRAAAALVEDRQCRKCLETRKTEMFPYRWDTTGTIKTYRFECKFCIRNRNTEYSIARREKLGPKKTPGPTPREKIIVDTKECRICKETKDASMFPIRKDHAVDGLRNECLSCKYSSHNVYTKDRCKKDSKFKLMRTIRARVNSAIFNKCTRSIKYAGCDIVLFKKWIEFQFEPQMNWDNHGSYWHIDHVVPVSAFNITNRYEQFLCFNWKNTQPLVKEENISKSDKILGNHIINNIITTIRFIRLHKLNSEYQGVREIIHWLRNNLRYGKKLSDDTSTQCLLKWAIRSQAPKSVNHSIGWYCKDMEKVQRLDGSGLERPSKSQ